MLDILRDELERSFDPEALRRLARDALGIARGDLPATGMASAVAAALIDRCLERDAVAALCDVVVAARPASKGRLQKFRQADFDWRQELARGRKLEEFTLDAELGFGPSATVYSAHDGDRRYRLRMLHPSVATRRAAVQRYLAVTRLATAVGDERLPKFLAVRGIAGRTAIVQEFVSGEPLSFRLEPKEPTKLRRVWPMLRRLLEALTTLHSNGLVHGALKPENVLVDANGSADDVLLLDAGAHYLHESMARIAPEQCLGDVPTPRTDVYAFGALLYSVLAGKTPFAGNGLQRAAARFQSDFEPLSFVCPRGWVTSDLDEFVLAMLHCDPERRPADAEAVLDALETIAGHSVRRDSKFPDDELEIDINALLTHPERESAAAVLEAAVDQGADPRRIAEAFRSAAEKLDASNPVAFAAQRKLLLRCGKLYETLAEDLGIAERCYRALLGSSPADSEAWNGLDRIYRHTGRYEALCELLVDHVEVVELARDKADILSRLGDVLATKLGDRTQALLAYVHAWLEEPANGARARRVEEFAGTDAASWMDVFSSCHDRLTASGASELSAESLITTGRWYVERLGRSDLALQCFQAVLYKEPKHPAALAETANILKRAQRWRELASVLVLSADGAISPAQRREFLCEAARVFEKNLGDTASATTLYEQIVGEDSDDGAAAQLCRLYLAANDLDAAREAFKRRLARDPENLDALCGLRKLHEILGDYPALVQTLEREAELSPTPRGRVEALERLAELYDRQFLDAEQAIATLERLLAIDESHQNALESLCRLYRKLARWPALAGTLERSMAHTADDVRRLGIMVELGHLLSGELADPKLAIEVYEKILEQDRRNPDALAALAGLWTTLGNVKAAWAYGELAKTETQAEKRAGLFARAGEVLEAHRDLPAAIDHYRRALAEAPNRNTASRLRASLAARGDVATVVEMLEHDLAVAETDEAKAELAVELAHLLFHRRQDAGRARALATRALERDPSNVQAHVLLGDIEAKTGHAADAARYYALPAHQADTLGSAEAVRVISAHGDALGHTGDTRGASIAVERLVQEFSTEHSAWQHAMELSFAYDTPERTLALTEQLRSRWDSESSDTERARVSFVAGESLRLLGRFEAAVSLLEKAISADPGSIAGFDSLARAYRATNDWVGLSRTLGRWLQRTSGTERVHLLVEIGDLSATTFGDPAAAAQSYRAALAASPGDRRVLLKLVQLYTDQRDWHPLLESVLTLVDCVDDPRQKAKYLQTAARIAANEIGDLRHSIELLDRALAYDNGEEILRQAVQRRSSIGDKAGIARLLEQQIAVAAQGQDRVAAARFAGELADMYLADLDVAHAVSINEAVLHIDPENHEREDLLLELYSADAVRYLDRALVLVHRKLWRDPLQPEPYQSLYGLYDRAGRPDGAWCAAQALSVMERATPEQLSFFEEHRRCEPLGRMVGDSDVETRIVEHPSLDPALTRLFAEIEPVVIAARGTPITRLGNAPVEALDADTSTADVVVAVRRAATLLGMRLPLLLTRAGTRQSIRFGRCQPPALLIGGAAMTAELPPLATAFVAAAHLAYFRPGFYVRTLVPSASGLKAWVIAAIKVIAPKFPAPLELEGPVTEALRILQEGLSGAGRERLAEPVDELLRQSQRLDLHQWLAAVDLSSDRAGFLACDDLTTVFDIVRETGNTTAAVSVADRTRELLRFAVSPEYVALRARLELFESPSARVVGGNAFFESRAAS